MSFKKVLWRLLCLVILAAVTLFSGGCSSIPERAGPDECLVVIKTERINTNGAPIGRGYYLHYSGDSRPDTPSHIGDNSGKFVTVVIKSRSARVEWVSTAPVGSFRGDTTSFLFYVPLPYEPGKAEVADFVVTETIERGSTPTVAEYFDRISLRRITSEEKDALMSDIKADSSFGSWFSAHQ